MTYPPITVQCPDCGDYFDLDGLNGLIAHALEAHPTGLGAKVVECFREEVDAL